MAKKKRDRIAGQETKKGRDGITGKGTKNPTEKRRGLGLKSNEGINGGTFQSFFDEMIVGR